MQILYSKEFKKSVKIADNYGYRLHVLIYHYLGMKSKKIFLRCFVQDYDTKLNILYGNEFSVIFVRRQSNEGYKCIIF